MRAVQHSASFADFRTFLNNGGAQFVTCFNNELFSGKLKNILTWAAFIMVGLSVIINVSAYLTGAAAVFRNWFGLDEYAGMLLFYLVCTAIVFVGIKLVGICEKLAVGAMVIVIVILLTATFQGETCPMPAVRKGLGNAMALFGIVGFSLSAVMSTPQVVKGLGCDAKRIRKSIVAGVLINATIVSLVTVTTLLGAGNDVTEDGALIDLARHLGGWVSVVGYMFTLLALATSFWTNAMNLRDIILEQTHWSRNAGWLAASIPPLIFAMAAMSSFVSLSRLASVIQVVTSLGIIIAYSKSRKRTGRSPLLGRYGTVPYQAAVLICSLMATIGAVMKIK